MSEKPARSAISGTVTDAQGQPVVAGVVLITGNSPTHLDIAALTNAQGYYRFGGLIPGSYTLLVNIKDHAQQAQHVHTFADLETRLDFWLRD